MTKERLYYEMPDDDYRKMLDFFFESNVVIPKGENRHPNADVLHEWVEDTTKNIEVKLLSGGWATSKVLIGDEYRIKPSEPVYEYKVRMMYSDGTYEIIDKYLTVDEYRELGFLKKICTLEDTTKRIKQ